MTTENPEAIKIDFYALGKTNKIHQNPNQENYKPISNYSNNILERNALSLNSSNLQQIRNNFKNLHSSSEIQLKETNNYLNPINMYKSKDIYQINPNFTNKGTFNVLREKYFASDVNRPINDGMNLSKLEFAKKKRELDSNKQEEIQNKFLPEIEERKPRTLKENTFFFDKSTNKIIRYYKGFWDYNEKYIEYS